MLVEMDGFDTKGRDLDCGHQPSDVLDPALMRPGTFRPANHRCAAPGFAAAVRRFLRVHANSD